MLRVVGLFGIHMSRTLMLSVNAVRTEVLDSPALLNWS